MNAEPNDAVTALFLDFSVRKLELMSRYLHTCLERLSEQQIWQRGGEHENAVGNLVLHLCGNMRQWILFGIDGQPDVRLREAEFASDGSMSRVELLALFDTTVGEANAVISALSAERLTQRINPQNGEVSVLGAIYQVVGHVQQHVGQIIWATKQMTASDLDLSMPRPR